MNKVNEFFCDKNIRPWIIAIIILGIITVIWATVSNEEIFNRFMARRDRDAISAQQLTAQSASPQLVARQIPVQPQNMMLNAITRATPNGGLQLVHGNSLIAFQDVFKNAFRSVESAVVDIHAICVNKNIPARRGANPQAHLFTPPFTGKPDRFIGRRPYENIGAGFIVDAKGYVVTNYHVVENATSIVVTVTAAQTTDFQAKVVMTDPALDIALLKIMSNDLFSVCPLGNSSQVSIGDWVIAIGSPFGLDMSATAGIISGIRKSINIEGNVYQDLLQTDTPINKGNSGGPLINLNGEVIGITTAIYAPTGVFSGAGFAIPVDSIKVFLRNALGPAAIPNLTPVAFTQQFTQQQNAPMPGLNNSLTNNQDGGVGIEVLSVNNVIAREFRLPVTRGVLINRVYNNSPAQNAGLLRGDTIVVINGVSVVNTEQISNILQNAANQRVVTITFYRNGRETDCQVLLR